MSDQHNETTDAQLTRNMGYFGAIVVTVALGIAFVANTIA